MVKTTCHVRDWAFRCVIKFVCVTHDLNGVSYWMDVLPKLFAISFLFDCVSPLCCVCFSLDSKSTFHFIQSYQLIVVGERNIKKGQLVGW